MKLLEALALTYAAVDQQMSDAGLEIVAYDLKTYPLADVLVALARCRKELKRIALVDILDRIPGGHPSSEEAWAVCAPALNNERITIVWTEPMARAFGVALNLQDDPVAARMAFKEVYTKAVGETRLTAPKPKWLLSPGFDANQRAEVVEAAVSEGKFLPSYAQQFLIAPVTPSAIVPAMKNEP